MQRSSYSLLGQRTKQRRVTSHSRMGSGDLPGSISPGGPTWGEDIGCWGAHVGLKYHGALGSPTRGPKDQASQQDGTRVS